MIRNEYLRFMQTLNAHSVPEDVRKVANLVLSHLDIIQPLGTQQGQRVKKLVKLAQAEWQTLVNDIVAEADEATENRAPIIRLKSLSVGPFRGFARQEDFDLNSQLVLIYGPNGTGKSSFCEALEYGLLGEVAEAESKRFRQQEEYFKNAHVGRFIIPEIEALDEQGATLPVTANEAQYRFCFVEKNRIDNFSRIAAHAPARQTELISTLFGLDSFYDFVGGFSSEIEDRYIDLVGAKSLLLQKKKQTLIGHNQTIKDNNQLLTDLTEQEATLANQFKPDSTFDELVNSLGTPEFPGEIAALEVELQQKQPILTGLTTQALIDSEQAVINAHNKLSEKQLELNQASEGLSFKQLYTAVTALSDVSSEQCPVCKTPIDQVTINPFDYAIHELEKLAHLSLLEQDRNELQSKLTNAINSVYQILKVATEQLGTEAEPNSLTFHVREDESHLTWDWWQALHAEPQGENSAWQLLQQQIQTIAQRDIKVEKANQEVKPKQDRLVLLREYGNQVLILQTKRITLEEGVHKSNTVIETFDETNKGLIIEVNDEKSIVAINQKIATSYSEFVSLITKYKNALPSQLVADLGDIIVTLYNAFNRNDMESDLLAAIKLPLKSEQSIQIAFKANPEKYYDALHILSEGHIRCVGLAILLAKNLKENCPILIFDDPVNAIDDDHREFIRKTLFEDDFFEGKQIILTCHGEEFLKDIQNLLGIEKTRQARNFTFLPQLDEKHIRINFNSTPRNYLLSAQSYIDSLEIREALAKSRQALEALAKGKVWQYVSKYGDGNLSIKMRSANSSIELRNLTEQLKSKLAHQSFSHENRDAVLQPIETLLGINGDSQEWRYLNKGTHEENDRAEFERTAVSEILRCLVQIDAVLS